jgi:hypothetical protein
VQRHVLGEGPRPRADLQHPCTGRQVLIEEPAVYLERDPASDILAQPFPLCVEGVEDLAYPGNRVIRS